MDVESPLDSLVRSMLEQFTTALFRSLRDAKENRSSELAAVIAIQSSARGFLFRKRLNKIRLAAISVQSGWRGFKAREEFRHRKAEWQRSLRQLYFSKMVTRIQSQWRGYSSRKYIHDFYARKQYIQRILMTNKEVRKMLQASELEALRFQEQEMETRRTEVLESEMLRLHHMTSTKCTPGILPTLKHTVSTELNMKVSEEAIKSHYKTTVAEEMVKRTVQSNGREHELDRSTIRVSGPLDPLREELRLEKRVSARIIDLLHKTAFSTKSKLQFQRRFYSRNGETLHSSKGNRVPT